MPKTIVSMFLSGLFFGSGPCVAGCGPLFLSYIAGSGKNIGAGLYSYCLFSLSRISAYVFLGVLIFFLGNFALRSFFSRFSSYSLIAGGSFTMLIGFLIVLGRRPKPAFLSGLQKRILGRDRKSLLIMGLAVGFVPCAPLFAFLSYAGLISDSWVKSFVYSFAFGAGTFFSPLIFLTLLAGLLPGLFTDREIFLRRAFSFICGVIIIILGLELARKGVLSLYA